VAPLGDPLELLVRGGSISIRRAEAEVCRCNKAKRRAFHTPLAAAARPRAFRNAALPEARRDSAIARCRG